MHPFCVSVRREAEHTCRHFLCDVPHVKEIFLDYVALYFLHRLFEQISTYCENYGTLIPVSFVLGFYVSIVVGRWWDQYKAIPWPDPVAVFVSASIHGQVSTSRRK